MCSLTLSKHRENTRPTVSVAFQIDFRQPDANPNKSSCICVTQFPEGGWIQTISVDCSKDRVLESLEFAARFAFNVGQVQAAQKEKVWVKREQDEQRKNPHQKYFDQNVSNARSRSGYCTRVAWYAAGSAVQAGWSAWNTGKSEKNHSLNIE